MAVAEIDALSGFKFDTEEQFRLTEARDLQVGFLRWLTLL